jgi:hypothetical protein
MAHVTPTLASVFCDKDDSASWSKLKDSHELSQLRSKFWGKSSEEEAKEWRELHPTVNDDPTDDIGPGCYGLDLGIKFQGSKLWVRQDYIRAYNYCRERYEEGPSDETEMPRSVVITGQPGIGVFPSSESVVASCALFNNPSREKVNHIGSFTPSVVVSANGSHFFGLKVPSASYLSRMECFNNTSTMSPPVSLCRSYGRSSMQMDVLVFPITSLIEQTFILCSPPLRTEVDGSL